jgi:electron transport complex protein RnfD
VVFTSGRAQPERASVSLQMVLRDQLPPLEDFIIGGQPAAIGTGSALAVLIGGLFLIYRGLIDYRVPLLIVLAAAAAMLVLPVPLVITDTAVQWQWLALRAHYLGWPAALTFVNYELLASPLLFVAFFLATAPILRPITRRGRMVFAVGLGFLCAPAQLYASVAYGPFIALLLMSMATPLLDRVFNPRRLV